MQPPKNKGKYGENGRITVTKAKKQSVNFVEYAYGEKCKNML